jgi:hypothetical protein
VTSRREFFKVVAATAAVLVVPSMGIRLARTHLGRGDVRELIQYSINLDEFMYRCDVLFPHPAGVLLKYARHPTDTMIQFNAASAMALPQPPFVDASIRV